MTQITVRSIMRSEVETTKASHFDVHTQGEGTEDNGWFVCVQDNLLNSYQTPSRPQRKLSMKPRRSKRLAAIKGLREGGMTFEAARAQVDANERRMREISEEIREKEEAR